MLKNMLLLSLLIGLFGCKEENPDPLRLDHSVKPQSQLIALAIDPDKDSYFGSVEIRIDITERIDSFRFHARDLGIIKVMIKSESMAEPLNYSEGEKGTITATAPQTLEPGLYSLSISFTNDFSHQGTGLYKVDYEGRNYLFSQMEPEYARNSFPCWDAPEFKIPWELQLIIPSNQTAYANTPIKSERMIGGL
jgi:alanyl aminopeptidase